MGIIRDSFVMFKNWAEAIDSLPEEYQLETYKALVKYGLNGEMPKNCSPVVNAMLISFSVGMETNIARYNASIENGKKGGRPPKDKTQETQQNLEKPNRTQENQVEPRQNLNVNVNVNDNVNDIKLVKESLKNNNVFNNYACASACERVPFRTEQEREHLLIQFSEYFQWCFSEVYKDAAYEVIDTIIEASEQASTDDGLKFNGKKYTLEDFNKVVEKIDYEKLRQIVMQRVRNVEIENPPLYILGCVLKSGG